MPAISPPISVSDRASTPLWSGPDGDGHNGGITFSQLSRFLVCRERFRLYMVEGLTSADTFNHRIEYGSLFHTCQEHYEPGKSKGRKTPSSPLWIDKLLEYANSLVKRYPLQQEQINFWTSVCQVQFPHYIRYWERHPDTTVTTPLLREKVFDVRYTLPSKRTVRLRGKWDGIDLIDGGIYLLETKTKGDIDEVQLKRQLLFDLQVMLYLVAIGEYQDHSFWNRSNKSWRKKNIKGFRYNVIRRPCSGGRHSISQKKNETQDEFFERLSGIIGEFPEFFFMRWRVEILPSDIERFKVECLNPILEQLLDWWNYVSHSNCKEISGVFGSQYGHHFRMPYGVYNPLLEGNPTDLDNYLSNKSEIGLRRTTDLFPELGGVV